LRRQLGAHGSGIVALVRSVAHDIMRKPPAAVLLLDPFSFTNIALRYAEMLLASAQVIAIRTTRAAVADPRHRRRDRRELMLMGQEKLAAGTESLARMNAQWLGLGMHYAVFGWNQWLAWGRLLSPLGMLSAPAAMQAAMLSNTKLVSTTLRSTARVAEQGLKPIHRRATRNARRLRKRR
jgi:hypothetical protein